MNAPSPFQYLPLSKIVPSPTNKRRIRQDKLQELANNIKANGVMQPILVRPIGKDGRAMFNAGEDAAPAHYEIVAGERRWRASQLAGEEFIPAMVRELLDLDALQLQVFENLHRDDLHAMEEAEAFDQLLKRNQDLIGLSVDELALKVDKSRSYVYASLKLLDLCPYARDAFFDGKIGKETSVLIARIPGEALQTKALKEVMEGSWEGGIRVPMSFRVAARHLQDRYMLQLSAAPFKTSDESLVPAAGSCRTCPKRTGNFPELFSDVKSPDVCTDPDCFASKKAAHVEQLKEEGRRVIEGEEAKRIMPNTWEVKGDYVKLDENCPGRAESFQKLLGKDLPEPITVVRPADGKLIQILPKQAALEALEQKGIKVKLPETNNYSAKLKEDERKAKIETAFRLKVLAQVTDKVRPQLLEDFRLEDYEQTIVARAMLDRLDHETGKRLLKLRNIHFTSDEGPYKAIKHLSQSIAEMPSGERMLLLLQMALIGSCYANIYSTGDPSALLQVAGANSIDIKPLRAEAEADFAPKSKGKKVSKQTAKTEKTAPTPDPAAQALEQTREIDGVDEEPAEAGQPSETPEPAAPADENLPPEFAEIKAKALAKKARKQGKKESATADGDQKASTAAAAEETTGATA